jgi:hypothetical protein
MKKAAEGGKAEVELGKWPRRKQHHRTSNSLASAW